MDKAWNSLLERLPACTSDDSHAAPDHVHVHDHGCDRRCDQSSDSDIQCQCSREAWGTILEDEALWGVDPEACEPLLLAAWDADGSGSAGKTRLEQEEMRCRRRLCDMFRHCEQIRCSFSREALQAAVRIATQFGAAQLEQALRALCPPQLPRRLVDQVMEDALDHLASILRTDTTLEGRVTAAIKEQLQSHLVSHRAWRDCLLERHRILSRLGNHSKR